MVVNWSDKDTLERLYIATLASLDNKVNVSEIARIYGQDMTHHSLENRLRKWKKEAAALKSGADGVPLPAKSPAKPRAKKGDTSPTKDAVKTGRVAKKKAAPKVKSEPIAEEDGEPMMPGGEVEDELDEFV